MSESKPVYITHKIKLTPNHKEILDRIAWGHECIHDQEASLSKLLRKIAEKKLILLVNKFDKNLTNSVRVRIKTPSIIRGSISRTSKLVFENQGSIIRLKENMEKDYIDAILSISPTQLRNFIAMLYDIKIDKDVEKENIDNGEAMEAIEVLKNTNSGKLIQGIDCTVGFRVFSESNTNILGKIVNEVYKYELYFYSIEVSRNIYDFEIYIQKYSHPTMKTDIVSINELKDKLKDLDGVDDVEFFPIIDLGQ